MIWFSLVSFRDFVSIILIFCYLLRIVCFLLALACHALISQQVFKCLDSFVGKKESIDINLPFRWGIRRGGWGGGSYHKIVFLLEKFSYKMYNNTLQKYQGLVVFWFNLIKGKCVSDGYGMFP